MAELKIQVKADITGIEKLIDQLKGLQTYKMYEGADQTLVDLDDLVKIFTDHVEAEVAQPQWRCEWIPCSDSLPAVGVDVLVCYKLGKIRYVSIGELLGDGEFHGYDDEYLSKEGRKRKAVAWMPLPEPYREGEQDE